MEELVGFLLGLAALCSCEAPLASDDSGAASLPTSTAPSYSAVPGVRRLQDLVLEETGSAFWLRCIVSLLRPAVSLLRLHGGSADKLQPAWLLNQPVSSKSPTTSS